MLEILAPILQTGAVGAMLIMTWKLMVRKDKRYDDMITAINVERKEMYESQKELVIQVTTALVDKNNTDEKMASALEKLTDHLTRGKNDETA